MSDLVKVGYASNQAEAEMIEGLLKQYGIPCLLQRTLGFDVPDFLAAGPRDILVHREHEDEARKILTAP